VRIIILCRLVFAVLLILMGSGPLIAEQPLDQDDVALLLLSGATAEKKTRLILKRGIAFQITPELEQQFRGLGGDDTFLSALQSMRPNVVASANPVHAAATFRGNTAPSDANRTLSRDVNKETGNAIEMPAIKPVTKMGTALPDPPPPLVAKIIREFARRDKEYLDARRNYAYHQLYRVRELDDSGNVVGTHHQEWDIVFDDRGRQVTRETCPTSDTLQRLWLLSDDVRYLRYIQPTAFLPEELPDYDFSYLGHVKIDEITAYMFSVRAKVIDKHQPHFQGTIWVEDRDLQVVKTKGTLVPDPKPGKVVFFPFTEYREQLGGKYWFPTVTLVDDIIDFQSGPIHVKALIKCSDYRQFKSQSRIIPVM